MEIRTAWNVWCNIVLEISKECLYTHLTDNRLNDAMPPHGKNMHNPQFAQRCKNKRKEQAADWSVLLASIKGGRRALPSSFDEHSLFPYVVYALSLCGSVILCYVASSQYVWSKIGVCLLVKLLEIFITVSGRRSIIIIGPRERSLSNVRNIGQSAAGVFSAWVPAR